MPAGPSNPVERKILSAREGTLALCIGRMQSGWLVLADTQPVVGYCQLLADPIVPSLNALSPDARADYLRDTVLVGDALLDVLAAARINYETWCNLVPVLHTHVVPRYADEPDEQRVAPLCVAYDIAASRPARIETDGETMTRIASFLMARGVLRR